LDLAHLLPDYSHHEALYRKFRERGNFSLLMAQQGFTVTGVDISSTAIEWAVERAKAASSDVCFRAKMPTIWMT
jgi:tRNA/tmRNA/rRNA uracil-C5-methylase (TrmA/RlmC/RlmD family)